MTQVIAALTHDNVLVASDRLLTIANGPRRGESFHNDTCKLVSLCNYCGIAYSGLAQLQGQATHEWIAVQLAKNNCQDPGVAAEILKISATCAMREAPFVTRQEFLIAGWAMLADRKTLVPHVRLISNVRDMKTAAEVPASVEFASLSYVLPPEKAVAIRVIGVPLSKSRDSGLCRLLEKLVEKEIRPREAMRGIVEAVIDSSKRDSRVGEKILCFSIPRSAALSVIESGESVLLAKEPDTLTATFCYFDPTYSQLRQYGPTFVCGSQAVTDVVTESDPSRDYQSSSVKILYLPGKDG